MARSDGIFLRYWWLWLFKMSSGERYVGCFVIAAVGVALIGLIRTMPRPPELVIEYRNKKLGGASIVSDIDRYLILYLKNVGVGHAEAIEAAFDRHGAKLYNASGNSPDRRYLDDQQHPPHFFGNQRVLGPGEEWPIASLQNVAVGQYNWTTSARGMATKAGTVDVTGV